MRALILFLVACTLCACISGQDSVRPPSYAEKLRAAIKPHIVIEEPVDGNPVAEIELRVNADGKIQSWRLVKSSGVSHWDMAVGRAMDRTGKLPLDVDGRVPSVLIIAFRPR
jgi:colicin import membrane protein